MCRLFIEADPALWESHTKSLRLHGLATSLRLETFFWNVLAEIAGRDGLTLSQLIGRLHDELLQERGAVDNMASFLRVCCGRYLALQRDGAVPTDTRIPLRSLDASQILLRERNGQHRNYGHPDESEASHHR